MLILCSTAEAASEYTNITLVLPRSEGSITLKNSSAVPSAVPSSSPSRLPSVIPSLIPSLLPSSVPSTHAPSDVPTQLPSSSPTMACHDHAGYRSPINGLSCKHHQGTDCTVWKYVLGENITVLQQLISSCPISCNIPCGALSQQLIVLSFTISNIAGLLNAATQTPLEEVALDYLTDYVDANYIGEGFTFVLETVDLKSQERLLPRQQLRALQEATSGVFQLRVFLTLFGFSIGVDSEQLTQLLVEGMDSVGFTHALQASSTFYEMAQASSAVLEFPKAINYEPQSDSFPVVIITVAVLAGVVVLALVIAIVFLVFHKKRSSHKARVATKVVPVSSLKKRSSRKLVELFPVSPPSISSVYSFSDCCPAHSPMDAPHGTRFYPSNNMLDSITQSKDSDENSIVEQKSNWMNSAGGCSDTSWMSWT
jgi:hypothetical protein